MKVKTHSLPKSFRDSKRYFELNCSFEDLKEIKKSFLYLFGVLKFAESDFGIKDIDSKNIVKINSEFANEFILSVNDFNKRFNKNIKITKISGTIKSLVE